MSIVVGGKKRSILSRSGWVKAETISMGGWWKGRGQEAEVTLCTQRFVSPPKQESTICLLQTLISRSLFLNIRNSSAVRNNRWWCWSRSVQFMLLFDPECSLNKGQQLEPFTSCSQSSSKVFNICWLTVASTAVVFCSSCDSDIRWHSRVESWFFTVTTEDRGQWWQSSLNLSTAC